VVPIAVGFGRLGLTPNMLTLIGFGIAIVAAVAAAQQAWLLAGVLVIGGGVFDLFDGALARATNTTSRVGAFLDSVFDRAGEAVVYVGIAFGGREAGSSDVALLSLGALAASSMVSYTRAKSESLGFTPGTGMANVGLAPREVRIVILTLGLILTGLSHDPFVNVFPSGIACTDTCPTSSFPLVGALLVIVVLATITTIQRIVHVIRQSTSEEHE